MMTKLHKLAASPPLSIFLLFCLLLPFLYAQGAVARNLWGIQYLQTAQPMQVDWPAQALTQHPRLRLWLAQDAVNQGWTAQAQQWLEPLRLDPPPSIQTDARRLQGTILEAQGEFDQAIALWQENGSVALLLEAAKRAEAAAAHGRALQAYEAAYAVDSETALGPLALFLWRTLQVTDEAERLLRDGIETYQDLRARKQWLQILGSLYRTEQRWQEAENVYTTLSQLEPTNMTHAIQLGWVSYERGDDVQVALAHLQHATLLAPNAGDGYLAIAQLFIRQKDFAAADGWLLEALARNDSNLNWWLTYAANAATQERWDEAIARYTAAASKFPDAPTLYYQLAGIYLQTQQLAEADAAMQQALALAAQPIPDSYQKRAAEIQAAATAAK